MRAMWGADTELERCRPDEALDKQSARGPRDLWGYSAQMAMTLQIQFSINEMTMNSSCWLTSVIVVA